MGAAATALVLVTAGGCGGAPAPIAPAGERATDVGGAPIGVARAGSRVFVLDRGATGIRQLVARDLTPAATLRPRIPRDAFPVGIVPSAGVVWAAYAHPVDRRGWLVTAGPGIRRPHVRGLPVAPASVAPARTGGVLVVGRDGSVLRAAGRDIRRVPAASGRVRAAADGPRGVWVLGEGPGGADRLERVAGRRTVPLGPGAPAALAAGARGVWVVAGCGRRLAWVPAGAGSRTCTPVAARLVAASGRTAWAVEGRTTLVRLTGAAPGAQPAALRTHRDPRLGRHRLARIGIGHVAPHRHRDDAGRAAVTRTARHGERAPPAAPVIGPT